MAPEQAWRILKTAELVCDAQTVRDSIERLAREISAELSERNPVVLVVMRGGVFFAGQILPLLRFPLELDYIHASRYGNETSGGKLHWKILPPPSVRGRCVLVLDDILDAGETLAAIRAHLEQAGAASSHLAVLTEKNTGQPKPVKADYVGITVPNKYLFGCGLDVSGAWRNLPEIYALVEKPEG